MVEDYARELAAPQKHVIRVSRAAHFPWHRAWMIRAYAPWIVGAAMVIALQFLFFFAWALIVSIVWYLWIGLRLLRT